jgi:hypothetical protein
MAPATTHQPTPSEQELYNRQLASLPERWRAEHPDEPEPDFYIILDAGDDHTPHAGGRLPLDPPSGGEPMTPAERERLHRAGRDPSGPSPT